MGLGVLESMNSARIQDLRAVHWGIEVGWSFVLLMIYPPRVIGSGSASTHPFLVRDDTKGVKVILSGFPSATSMRRPL